MDGVSCVSPTSPASGSEDCVLGLVSAALLGAQRAGPSTMCPGYFPGPGKVVKQVLEKFYKLKKKRKEKKKPIQIRAAWPTP